MINTDKIKIVKHGTIRFVKDDSGRLCAQMRDWSFSGAVSETSEQDRLLLEALNQLGEAISKIP